MVTAGLWIVSSDVKDDRRILAVGIFTLGRFYHGLAAPS